MALIAVTLYFLGAKRILIVDDNNAVSAIAAEMARLLGHLPFVAWGVESALSIWRETGRAFDFALIDYSLNDGSGTVLAAQLLRDKPSLRVIIATGMNEGDILDLPPGVQFIPKPFSIDDLRNAIAGAV